MNVEDQIDNLLSKNGIASKPKKKLWKKRYVIAIGSFLVTFLFITMLVVPVFNKKSGFDILQSFLDGNKDKNIASLGDGPHGEWVIDGDTVYIDDEYLFASATPHTLASSGWVTFNFTSKIYEGQIDFIWGFDEPNARPTNPQIWANYSHPYWYYGVEEDNGCIIIENVTSYTALGIENYDNYSVTLGNKNNLYLYAVNYNINESGIFAFITYEQNGNDFILCGNYDKSIKVWDNQTYFDWLPWDAEFEILSFDYGGMNTWYLLEDAGILSDTGYKIRAYMNIPFGGLNGTSGKYWWAFKPSSESLDEAIQNNHFYCLDPWWDSSWNFFKTITIDHNYIDADLVNFPILVAIPDATADKCDGGDSIRFLLPDNSTELPYEIEQWTDGSDRIVWVNVSRVESGSDSVILMYYNNSGASDGQNITGTWNDEYMAVWHMSSLNDSTSNDVDLINTGADYVSSGLIGGCYDYVSANTDFLTHATFLDVIPATDELTFETYVESDSFAVGAYPTILTKENILAQDRIYFRFEDYPGTGADDELALFAEGTNDGANFCTEHTVLTVDTPYYCVGMYKKDTALKIIRDGTIITTGDACSNIRDGTYTNFCIGSHTGDAAYFDGEIDEVRISSIIRNDSWIKATFHSLNQTTDFITWGSETSAPAENTAPTQSAQCIWDGTTNKTMNTTCIAISPTSFNVTLNDAEGDAMNITMRTNASGVWQDVNYSGNLGNGTYSNFTNTSWVDSWNTKYWISYNLTAAGNWTNNTFYFTTRVAPTVWLRTYANGSVDVPLTPTVYAQINTSCGYNTDVYFSENSTGSWVQRQSNKTISSNSSLNWTFTQANTGNTQYWYRINRSQAGVNSPNATNWYTFTTVVNTSWQDIVTTINGSSYNITKWKIFDSTINGSSYNITHWNDFDNTINGSSYNITGWDAFDSTINGSSYNITGWDDFDTTINGSSYNITHWNDFDNTINGSSYNITGWDAFDSTINGSSYNITGWDDFDTTINGSSYNVTGWNVFDAAINGSSYNITGWHIFDSTINGSSYNISLPSNITITEEYPNNETTIFSIQPIIYFTLTSTPGLTMNYTIYVGNSTANCTTILTNDSNVANGTYFYEYYSATNYTSYYWRVWANDGTTHINETYHFNASLSGGGRTSYIAIAIIGMMLGTLGLVSFLMIGTKRRKKENI